MLHFTKRLFTVSLITLVALTSKAQIVINEGSNRNFQSVYDEDVEAEDWIELYNSGSEVVDLFGYSLMDQSEEGTPWVFPHYDMQPGEFLIVFLSGKDRYYTPAFEHVAMVTDYVPFVGWNTHNFDVPFEWDGVSDIVINSCSYSNTGYISNSVFNQTDMGVISSTVAYNDYNDASCSAVLGEVHTIRPNIQLNGLTIGGGNNTNGYTDYPAPYGNWYWSARNQMLYKAEELQNAGVSAGPIESIAWDVVATDAVTYTYIDISIQQMQLEELTNVFQSAAGIFFHTDFKLSSEGETVYLYDPFAALVDSMHIDVPTFEATMGSYPDGSDEVFTLQPATPGASNNDAVITDGIASAPLFSVAPGVYPTLQYVDIIDTNGNGQIHYTTNGDEPTSDDPMYDGEPIVVFQSMALRARTFATGLLPSEITSGAYLINVNHTTPILSVQVDNDHLYGSSGIFDNWQFDWERYAQVMYFDSTAGHPLLFERNVAMQIDGGAGGSRAHPQHSFRLEFDKTIFDGSEIEFPLLNNRPDRDEYSRMYFRNGSNMWLTLPYKDAAQTEMMCRGTNGYFSAMRPVSVYINGSYFGLYEMREKLDAEFYEVYDGAAPTDLLNLSYWYGGMLRGTVGDPQNYWDSWGYVASLDPQSTNYLEQVNTQYDLVNYTDYMISEIWMGNADWPYNNIKIHRSDSTLNRWRFTTIDLELALAPGSWTDCAFNGIEHVANNGVDQPFTGLWLRAMNNEDYRNYFIDRYADLMNTEYRAEKLLAVEENHFDKWVVEMPNEFQRWADPWNVSGYMNAFYDNHLAFQADLQCKSEINRDLLEESLQLDGQFTLTLEASPAGAGYIHINTITPASLPWDGIYYNGVPVVITAIANEGYAFDHWIQNGEIANVNDSIYFGAVDASEIVFHAVFESTVGVEEETATSIQHTPVLWPNPADHLLQITDEGHRITSWEIYGLNGQLIESDLLRLSSERFVIPIDHLAEGMYVMKLKYQDGSVQAQRWFKKD